MQDSSYLVVLEGTFKVTPVAPSEDHVRRSAEYLDRDYRYYAEYLDRDYHDHDHVDHDVDN